eukprot:5852706-Pyramimonas_sp.AAC.1
MIKALDAHHQSSPHSVKGSVAEELSDYFDLQGVRAYTDLHTFSPVSAGVLHTFSPKIKVWDLMLNNNKHVLQESIGRLYLPIE